MTSAAAPTFAAVLGALPKAGMRGAVQGACDCGKAIMWSNRCPDAPPKRCWNCVADLFIQKPDAIVVAPSGIGVLTARSASRYTQ